MLNFQQTFLKQNMSIIFHLGLQYVENSVCHMGAMMLSLQL